ncbi:MAG: hypothetical protein HKM03_04875 [Steroidobacteraceae bacterium]|nr:hypothetical protein [Steroidobacteraceae bacterium]
MMAVLAACALSSCASSRYAARARRPGALQFFDERTGSNLSVVDQPLIFARRRTDVAAFAHDFATLVAIEIDVSGTDRDYLLLYRWSTVDPRLSAPPGPDQGELRILADGRELDLKPRRHLPVSLKYRSLLHVPNHGDVVAYAYRVSLRDLRDIAASRYLQLRMPQQRPRLPFSLWADARRALARFAGDRRAPHAPP